MSESIEETLYSPTRRRFSQFFKEDATTTSSFSVPWAQKLDYAKLDLTTLLTNYYALRQDLLVRFDKKEWDQSDLQRLQEASELANVLDIYYSRYLSQKSKENARHDHFFINDHERILNDQLAYDNWYQAKRLARRTRLKTATAANITAPLVNDTTSNTNEESDNSFYAERFIKAYHVFVNIYRLFVLRLRRWLVLLNALFQNAKEYSAWFSAIDRYLSPIFAYLGGFIFFLPRLTINCVETLKHTFESLHPNMQEEEKALGAWTRFLLQMQQRWPELFNDATWLISSILLCFVFIGNPVVAGIIMISMQTSDLVSSLIQSSIECVRLAQEVQCYEDLKLNQPEQVQADIQAHLTALNERIAFEHTILIANFLNFSLLLLAMGLTLISGPIMPIVGASLAILVTLAMWYNLNVYLPECRRAFNRPLPNPPEEMIPLQREDSALDINGVPSPRIDVATPNGVDNLNLSADPVPNHLGPINDPVLVAGTRRAYC